MLRRFPHIINLSKASKLTRNAGKQSHHRSNLENPHVRTIFSSFLKPKHDFGKCAQISEAGNVSEERPVPDHIKKPPYYFKSTDFPLKSGPSEIKNAEQIAGMRRSCKLAANILASAGSILKVGLTTDQIDEFVHNEAVKNNAYPSPLRYMGFPKSVCTSVNNVACHGIPDDRPLEDGDIINVDVTVYFEGFHGDCSKTFLIGNVDERGKFLVEATKEAMDLGISVCGPGVALNLIGNTIANFAHAKGLNVFPQFIGHGIGSYFHGPPEVYPCANSLGGFMKPGMTFTVEPILTLGDLEVEMWEDMWTIASADGARSAQFEHTILITDKGHEILTVAD